MPTEPKQCQAKIYGGDQMHCQRCDLTWDINDPYPPLCKSLEELQPTPHKKQRTGKAKSFIRWFIK